MNDLISVFLGCLLALGAVTALVLIRVHEAAKSGELRYWMKGRYEEQVIRRQDDPARFELELKILRAVPWFGFGALALAIAMLGYFV
ncbi:hypothetical protein [Sphingomonas sp. MS122]|uniref:hypothetical protein n=1 Tax=Sphingomonas sp. MS122 TaxID=3412683 RepID=UPI003C2BE90A